MVTHQNILVCNKLIILGHKMKKLNFLVFLILVVISTLTNCLYPHHHGDHNHDHKDFICTEQHEIVTYNMDQEEHLRSLQSGSPHPFRIYGQFPATTTTGIDLTILQRMFRIATKYYETVIQVTDLSSAGKLYSGGACGVTVPTVYTTTGFNQSIMDSVIFVLVEYNATVSYVAVASACFISRWPTYGYTKYNAAYVSTDLAKTGQFHNNVYVTMHQLGHVLGVSNGLFSYVYGSYNSTTFMNISSVKGTNANNRTMIILPNVKAYVQNFFNCNDTSAGPLIEEEGGSGSAGSHWERKIYYDDMMTASAISQGLKISPLTLNYFKDTGYYYSVDTATSQPSYYGKGKGCDFAMGISTATPQYCTGSLTACGFYNQFGGYCGTTDSFGSSSYKYQPYSNLICTMPQKLTSGPYDASYTYEARSRCFDIVNGGTNTPHCYIATCNGSAINIQMGNTSYACPINASTISTSKGTLNCPADYDQFCSRINCQNWCYAQGLCVSGTCILIQCTIAIPNCLTCTQDTLNRCTACSNSLFISTNKLACSDCPTAFPNCVSCLSQNATTKCLICNGTLYASADKLSCVVCSSAISMCTTCVANNVSTKCTSCSGGLFPDSTQLSCVSCGSAITNCLICGVENATTVCYSCGSSLYPASNKLSCTACDLSITNCLNCSIISNQTACSSCATNFTVSTDQRSCLNCGTSITNCLTCSSNTQCTSCVNPLYPNANGSMCVTCSVSITNCLTCSLVSGVTKCIDCSSGMVPSANQLSCVVCSTAMTNCATCSVVANASQCNSCSGGNVPSADKLSCVICSTIIQYCTTCTYNGTTTLCSACEIGSNLSNDSLSCVPMVCTITNCVLCVNASGVENCRSCNSSSFVSVDKLSCAACLNIIPNCGTCSNNNGTTQCSQCSATFYPNAQKTTCSTCANSITSCSTCTANNVTGMAVCTACVSGNILNSTTNCISCSSVIPNCVVCSLSGASTICTDCGALFPSLNQLTCVACSTLIVNCGTCSLNNGTTTCTTCSNSLILSANQLLCQTCPTRITNCNNCVQTSPSTVTCSSCSTGFYPSANQLTCGTCSSIISNCLECLLNGSNSTECSVCLDGFYLTNLTCQTCNSNCLTCDTLSTTCTSCKDGYYLNSNVCLQNPLSVPSLAGTCASSNGQLICQVGCLVCTCTNTTTTCTIAMEGYAVQGGQPIKCASGCSKCSPTNATLCTECSNRFALQSTVCVACHASCASCSTTNSSVCLTCPQGFNLVNSQCTQCNISNCKQCNSLGMCVTCKSGYSVIQNGSSCEQCLLSCSVCSQTDITTCLGCGKMYYLSNNSCVACSQGCVECSSSGCSRCMDGYTISISTSTCLKNCDLPCITCETNKPTSCLTCLVGYTYNAANKSCTPISTCTSACTNCPLGTVPSGNLCVSCMTTNCLSCSSSVSTCESCLKGFYLSGNSCLACTTGCSACIDSSRCLQCSAGFTQLDSLSNALNNVINGACYACSSPCKQCVRSQSRCSSCVTGYYLKGWKCLLQNNVNFVIKLNFNFAAFKSNSKHINIRNLILSILGSKFSSTSLYSNVNIVEGSTIVSGQIGNPPTSDTDLCKQSQTMQSSLASGSTIDGMSILQSTVAASSGDNKCPSASTTMNSYIIIGIAIGVPALIIIIVVVIVLAKKLCLKPQRLNETTIINVKEKSYNKKDNEVTVEYFGRQFDN